MSRNEIILIDDLSDNELESLDMDVIKKFTGSDSIMARDLYQGNDNMRKHRKYTTPLIRKPMAKL